MRLDFVLVGVFLGLAVGGLLIVLRLSIFFVLGLGDIQLAFYCS